MRQLDKQRGSTLIPLLGIIAAVAIMATALTSMVIASGGFTAHERTRTKAFNVSEASLNKAMFQLQAAWPADGEPFTWDNAAFETAFQAGAPNEFAAPPAGLDFSSVTVTDNVPDAADPTGPWPIYDKNNDRIVRVVVQANVGDRKTRLQADVERIFFETMMPRGVAIYSGANLDNSGSGNGVMPKISVEDAPADLEVSARVVGSIDDSQGNLIETGIITKQGSGASGAGDPEDVFPQSLVEALKSMADYKNGANENTDGDRYFTTVAAAASSPADTFSPAGGFSGLCVINDPSGADISLSGNVNSAANPGVLLSLDPDSAIDLGGTGNFYGVIYVAGPLDKSHGNFVVHGSFISTSNIDMRGTVEVSYSDAAIVKLDEQWPLNVKMVSNTWRELMPL